MPFELFSVPDAALLLSLVFIAMACISMGAPSMATNLWALLFAVPAAIQQFFAWRRPGVALEPAL